MYGIDPPVRKKLGDLSSERGDSREARKFNAAATGRPLSDSERKWVDLVVRARIRRKAEYDFDATANRSLITMADFPAI